MTHRAPPTSAMLLRPEIFLLDEDIETLRPRNLVNGMVINGFLRLIERRSCYYRHLPSVWAFDSSFRVDWLRGRYEATKWRVKNVEPFSKELLLFPIHLPNVGEHGHWSLVAAWPRRAEIATFDSLGSRGISAMTQMEWVLGFLRSHAEAKNLPFEADGWALKRTPADCPIQEDADSCGVFTCVFADRLARNSAVTRTVDATVARSTLAEILRRGRFDNEEFSSYEHLRPVPDPHQSPAAVVDLCSPVTPEPDRGEVDAPDEATGEAPGGSERTTPDREMGGKVSPAEGNGDERGESSVMDVEMPPTPAPADDSPERNSPCLSLQDGALAKEFAGEPASAPLAPRSLVGPGDEGSRRRLCRSVPEQRREDRRREERQREDRRREDRRRRDRRRKERSREAQRPDQRRARAQLEEARRPRTSRREGDRRPVGGQCLEAPGRRPTRRPRSEDKRHRRPDDLRRRLDATGTSTSHPTTPLRTVRPSLVVERRFDAPEGRHRRVRPGRLGDQSRRRTSGASGRNSFEIPTHLRDRLAELDAQGWSRKDLRNKRWTVTRQDGTRFRIRGAKLRKLTQLY